MPAVDLGSATAQNGEFFQYAANGHAKSVWFEVPLPTHRQVKIEVVAAPGNVIDQGQVGFTVYGPANCLPGSGDLISTLLNLDELVNPCLGEGLYRIQVTAIGSLSASVQVRVTLDCPADPMSSKFDCPENAFDFGVLPQTNYSYSGTHTIYCHSIDTTAENDCLPLANKAEYTRSAWYVFRTGARVDLVSFNFSHFQLGQVGYRLIAGDVRTAAPESLPLLACDLARQDGSSGPPRS